jgi:hypothetical protein
MIANSATPQDQQVAAIAASAEVLRTHGHPGRVGEPWPTKLVSIMPRQWSDDHTGSVVCDQADRAWTEDEADRGRACDQSSVADAMILGGDELPDYH